MTSLEPFAHLPRVPISDFKANPARYVKTGALVTNHGQARAAFVPIDDEPAQDEALDSVKAQLLLLTRVRNQESVARELAELSASRSQDIVGPPR